LHSSQPDGLRFLVGEFGVREIPPRRYDYRIALTARENTWPNPMITVSSNNQYIAVILDLICHLLTDPVCRQTDMYTVYIKEGEKASCISANGIWGPCSETSTDHYNSILVNTRAAELMQYRNPAYLFTSRVSISY
jgi:hypothetical protein